MYKSDYTDYFFNAYEVQIKYANTKKNDDESQCFRLYKDEKSTLEQQNIKIDYKNSVGKISNTKSYIRDSLSEYIF